MFEDASHGSFCLVVVLPHEDLIHFLLTEGNSRFSIGIWRCWPCGITVWPHSYHMVPSPFIPVGTVPFFSFSLAVHSWIKVMEISGFHYGDYHNRRRSLFASGGWHIKGPLCVIPLLVFGDLSRRGLGLESVSNSYPLLTFAFSLRISPFLPFCGYVSAYSIERIHCSFGQSCLILFSTSSLPLEILEIKVCWVYFWHLVMS